MFSASMPIQTHGVKCMYMCADVQSGLESLLFAHAVEYINWKSSNESQQKNGTQ